MTDANTNPMGLNLITMAQQALGAYITELVQHEVTKALEAQANGKAAATLLDDELTARITAISGTVFREMDEDRVNDLIDEKLRDHTHDYDHDDFMTREDVSDKVTEVLENVSLSLSIN